MKEITEEATDLLGMLSRRDIAGIKNTLTEMNPADIALLFEDEEITDKALPVLFRILPKDIAAEVFIDMNNDSQELLIKAFSDQELHEILDELFVDDTVDLVGEMPANVVRRILMNSNPETRRLVNEILKYPDDSAGSIMTTEYISLQPQMTVAQCFDRIRTTGLDSETIYTCYVINPDRTLNGLVTVKELLLANPKDTVGSIMNTNVIAVNTTDDKEDVAKQFDKYNFLAFPVVDGENRLVGIITFDDAIDVIRDEATEDFSKMAAVTPIDNTYFKASVWTHARTRILWLLILMISATVSASIITQYSEAFIAFPLLVACLPMIMDTGGNCGAQTSALIIRGVAVDEIHPKDFLRVWWKEIRIALIVGPSLAVVNMLRVFLIYGNYGAKLQLGIVTSVSLICTVLLAKSLGCILPMLAKRCKLDPAIMASPLITTIVDAVSVFVYFSIATSIFQV